MNISDDKVLSQLVGEVELDRDAAMRALTDPELVHNYKEEVQQADKKGVAHFQTIYYYASSVGSVVTCVGITGVPHFEIYLRDRPGMRQAVSGAQPPDTFIALFKRLRLLPKV